MSRLLVAALLALLVLAAPASAKTVMSCDAQWNSTPGGFKLDRGSIKYRSAPRKCRHESDGTIAGLINLVGLKWKHWGSDTAVGRGFTTANHANRNGKFPRTRVKVTVSGKRTCGGRTIYTLLVVRGFDTPLFGPRAC